MSISSTDKATEEFQGLLESNYYKNEWSVNCADDYSEMKETRDTEAVKSFVKSKDFEYIKELR